MRGMAGWTSSVLAFALVACSGGENSPANDARTPTVAQNAVGNAAGAPVPDANAAGNVAEQEADS